MAGAFVQCVENSANHTYVNITPTAGNALAWTSNGSSSHVITSVQAMSSTAGGGSVLGTFTILTNNQDLSANSSNGLGLYSVAYLFSLPSGTQSVLGTYTGGAPGTLVQQVTEVSGVSSLITSILAGQTNPGTSANAITSGTVSVGSIPAYILGVVANSGNSDTVAGTSFTSRHASTNQWFVEDRRETSSTGSYAVTATAATHGSGNGYITLELAFGEPSTVTTQLLTMTNNQAGF